MLWRTNRGLNNCSLYKIMLWNSHDPQASTNSKIAQDSTFYTRTPLAHNNMSSVHTHSLVHVRRKFTYGKSDPKSPSNSQSFPASVTPTGNCMPHNNSPKLVLHIPIEPDADPFIVFLFVRLI